MNIDHRYRRLLERRIPVGEQMIKEAYEGVTGSNTRYILGAMAPVGPARTKRLEEQGDRVENQLRNRLTPEYPGLSFRRQGSVSNRTHIRYYSDVDVLVLIDKFHTLQHPLVPPNPYKGDVINDILVLRGRCRDELKKAFYEATVDDVGSTAVSMSGGSLACAVDIVPSNWYNTVAYTQSNQEHDRGVQVLNKVTRERKENYPFLFNHRLAIQDSMFKGVTRMLIRLIKSVREDYLDENPKAAIDFSSFDICSIVYRMPREYYESNLQEPLSIVSNCLLWLATVAENQELRANLAVVDDTRKIFDTDEKLPGMVLIMNDLYKTWQVAVEEQAARISFKTNAHLAA